MKYYQLDVTKALSAALIIKVPDGFDPVIDFDRSFIERECSKLSSREWDDEYPFYDLECCGEVTETYANTYSSQVIDLTMLNLDNKTPDWTKNLEYAAKLDGGISGSKGSLKEV